MLWMWAAVGLMVTMVSAAPVAEQMEESEQTLSRAKRTDERIMFGNHQTKHRLMKKSDVDVPLKLDKNDLDRKANVEAELEPINDVGHNPDDKDEAASGVKLPEEAVGTVDGQTEALERLMSNSEDELENLQTPENDLQQFESSGEGDESLGPNKSNQEYYLYDYNYNPWEEQFRRKRSAHKKSAPLTAESMENAPIDITDIKSQRFKRDLTQDQIRELLENVVEDDTANVFSPESRDWSPDSREEEPGWSKDQLETLMTADDGEPRGEGPAYVPTEAEEEEIAIEEAKARLALVRLLQEEVAEAEAEQEQEEEAVAEALGAAILENSNPYQYEREEERDDEMTYVPIVYEGVPGIFIPTQTSSRQVAKRQYLSLVPGMRKRNWYPADNRDRWLALIPSEEKRNADAYERLYRLAQALNRKRK